jgi:hypothetical protein
VIRWDVILKMQRRRFALLGLSSLSGATLLAQTPSQTIASETVLSAFPLHPPELAREMVTVAHFNAKRVKELADARPALARAAVDWGFGDWEDALGAASHVGNREIAEYLLSKGARPSIFSAAMLGQLDVVRAFVAAQPGVQRTAGPHSISLLSHARAGGKQAQAVFDYLNSLGDAGEQPVSRLTQEEATRLAGVYVFGARPDERIEITEKAAQLTFVRPGKPGRALVHLGDYSFRPQGAEAVRVRFSGSGDAIMLTVHDPEIVVTAKRSQP